MVTPHAGEAGSLRWQARAEQPASETHDLPPVELYEHVARRGFTGIGRYTRELYDRLSGLISVRLVTGINPPLAARFTTLSHFPIGIAGHRRGSLVHFPQIMGLSQLHWRPVRPSIATIHDLGVLVCKEDEKLFSRIERAVLDAQFSAIPRVGHFAVNSEYTRDGLNRLFGISRDRVHFVQLGVDTEQFRPMPDARQVLAERYGIRSIEGTFDIVYTGSELPRKDLPTLLHALARLKGEGYRCRLIKVGGAGGDRWRERFLADARRFGVENDVVLAGTVSEEDLPRFYSAADLAVTPTLLEGGFAWLAMEAMACGRPVVASTMAMIPTPVQPHLLMFEPRDVEGLVAAIRRYLDDEDLRRRLGAAGPGVVAAYTWDATIAAMLDAYRAAVRKT